VRTFQAAHPSALTIDEHNNQVLLRGVLLLSFFGLVAH
jgi:hypothetical protein